ncbi:MAG: insulinase family protein [Oscillospiraceae bacterium]|jgi:predicted Zn-dependent peptidase|nr:insulinase family protein [Oscillospiraceae bacterium]
MKNKGYDAIREQVYSDRLPNGMPVYVIKKSGFHKSYAFFATDYGGADRRFKFGGEWIDTPEGVAHFLEHKMFDTEDGNALTTLSANGAQPNAFTSSGITAYHFESTEKFEENLKILLEFVSVPYFTKESVEKEQGIIGQEIRMTEDDPDHVVYYGLMKLLFRHNPARYSVAGTIESIAEITDETLYRCHKIFYNPSNMCLVVAGDVDPERVFEIAGSVLDIPRGAVPERDYGLPEQREPAGTRVDAQMEVSEPQFLIGASAEIPKRGEERLRREIVGELAASLVAGKSSPLYLRLYAEGLIKPDFIDAFETTAGIAYTLFGGSSPDPDRVLTEIQSELRRVLTPEAKPELEALFTRIKKAEYGRIVRSLDSFSRSCWGAADAYFAGYDYFTAADTMNKTELAEVLDFIAENMKPENLALSIVSPRAAETAAAL